jgi:drug/metabolite transporter (DMT)-like permease
LDVRRTYIGVVLASALIVAFESVAVEGALRIADLDIFLVSSMPSIIGGAILLGILPKGSYDCSRGLGRRGWGSMIVLCGIVAAGVFMWFDSVGRIGASKEAILGGGSSEVLFVVLLSAVFLGERLKRWEILGGFLIVIGVFLVLANVDTLSFTFGLGEIEAISSSLLLAISVVMITLLLRNHNLTAISGLELLISGLFLIVLGSFLGLIKWPDINGWLLLVALGIFPAVGLLTYNAGLPKIGASLTSVLFALNGIMTVGVQLLVLFFFPHADIRLPQILGLAVAGGVIAFVGVYLLNRRTDSKECKMTHT